MLRDNHIARRIAPLEPGFAGMRDPVYKKGDAKKAHHERAPKKQTPDGWVEHFSEVFDGEANHNTKFTRLFYHCQSNSLRDGTSCTIEALLDDDKATPSQK